MDWMQPSVTVSVAVPEIFGRMVDAAVIVVEPKPTAVASPEALMVATVWDSLLQATEVLP